MVLESGCPAPGKEGAQGGCRRPSGSWSRQGGRRQRDDERLRRVDDHVARFASGAGVPGRPQLGRRHRDPGGRASPGQDPQPGLSSCVHAEERTIHLRPVSASDGVGAAAIRRTFGGSDPVDGARERGEGMRPPHRSPRRRKDFRSFGRLRRRRSDEKREAAPSPEAVDVDEAGFAHPCALRFYRGEPIFRIVLLPADRGQELPVTGYAS